MSVFCWTLLLTLLRFTFAAKIEGRDSVFEAAEALISLSRPASGEQLTTLDDDETGSLLSDLTMSDSNVDFAVEEDEDEDSCFDFISIFTTAVRERDIIMINFLSYIPDLIPFAIVKHLFATVERGDLETFTILCMNVPRHYLYCVLDGKNLLAKAFFHQRIKFAEYLLLNQAFDPNHVFFSGEFYETALFCCTELGQILLLLMNRADPNFIIRDSNFQSYGTALHCAIISNDLEVVNMLLVNGANPYIKNISGKTCFELAEIAGASPAIKFSLMAYVPPALERASHALQNTISIFTNCHDCTSSEFYRGKRVPELEELFHMIAQSDKYIVLVAFLMKMPGAATSPDVARMLDNASRKAGNAFLSSLLETGFFNNILK